MNDPYRQNKEEFITITLNEYDHLRNMEHLISMLDDLDFVYIANYKTSNRVEIGIDGFENCCTHAEGYTFTDALEILSNRKILEARKLNKQKQQDSNILMKLAMLIYTIIFIFHYLVL